MNDRYSQALPPFPSAAWRGIFAQYRDLIANVSECPPAFHFANLLAVIAAELGDRVRLAEGKATYPNFYIFCCGKTGTKKSTASDLVQEHVGDFISNHGPNRQHTVFPSISSAEGLIRALIQHPNILLRYDEIKDLFVTAARSGSRIEPILNSAFDLRPIATVVRDVSSSLSATNYVLNLILNGTLDHVRLDLSEAMFAGGLLNRFLVFASEPTGVEIPLIQTPNAEAATAVAKSIGNMTAKVQTIAAHKGGISVGFTDEAKALHAHWYHDYSQLTRVLSDMQAKPLTRLDTYLKKLGMIYCMVESEPAQVLHIDAEQMLAAMEVIKYCQESMIWVTNAWSGVKTVQQQSEKLAEERVEAYVVANKCTSERELYRRLGLGAAECHRAVTALAEAGVVYVMNDRPRKVHFPRGKCGCFNGEEGRKQQWE